MLSPRRKFLDTYKELINTATTDSSFCNGFTSTSCINWSDHLGFATPTRGFSSRDWNGERCRSVHVRDIYESLFMQRGHLQWPPSSQRMIMSMSVRERHFHSGADKGRSSNTSDVPRIGSSCIHSIRKRFSPKLTIAHHRGVKALITYDDTTCASAHLSPRLPSLGKRKWACISRQKSNQSHTAYSRNAHVYMYSHGLLVVSWVALSLCTCEALVDLHVHVPAWERNCISACAFDWAEWWASFALKPCQL